MPTSIDDDQQAPKHDVQNVQALYLCEQVRSIEIAAKKNLPVGALMRAAGLAATECALRLLGDSKRKVLILAGPGDNGGDALETAHLLANAFAEVSIILFANEDSYSTEAKQSLHRARLSSASWLTNEILESHQLDDWDLIIDGLFGIGLNRPIEGDIAIFISQLNQQSQTHAIPVLALDVPSGLNTDTGQLFNDQAVAVRATHTISFIANKVGLHTAKGKDYAGEVFTHALNIDPKLFPPPFAHLLTEKSFEHSISKRQHDSHKGSYGEVLIIGGDHGMVGASLLAGRSALFCGAGRVYLGFIANSFPNVDILHPELMIKEAQTCDLSRPVVVIGPGMGSTAAAKSLLRKSLELSHSLVIDADALNLIAADEQLKELVSKRRQKKMRTLLTPHPLEAARLLNTSVEKIQEDRCHAAKTLAQDLQCCVVLKGAGTVIADHAHVWINSSGNASLATAGTGDVLTGVCGALLAQHQQLETAHAACLAVFLHGKAADDCVKKGIGPIGLSASELAPAIRTVLNSLIKI
jgi:hydroxyethylthiazole kinase-like uncharacterized protein yjeF